LFRFTRTLTNGLLRLERALISSVIPVPQQPAKTTDGAAPIMTARLRGRSKTNATQPCAPYAVVRFAQ
jgi:hypothetical protein